MKKISVVIPAFNEEKRLGKTLGLWRKFLKAGVKNFKVLEIIVVDDGSKDKTVDVAKLCGANLPIKIIKIIPNKGKGHAVKMGVKASKGDLVLVYDADAAATPSEIKRLLKFTDKFDVIIGSRTIEGAYAKVSLLRQFVGFCFHMVCLPIIPGIQDASCGAKLFSKKSAKKIFAEQQIKRFAFDIEILWLAKKFGFQIKEVGLKWQEIPGSKVNVLKDGVEMFFCVMGLYKRKFFD